MEIRCICIMHFQSLFEKSFLIVIYCKSNFYLEFCTLKTGNTIFLFVYNDGEICVNFVCADVLLLIFAGDTPLRVVRERY